MKKSIPAIISTFIITLCLAGGMFSLSGQNLLSAASAASAAIPAQSQSANQQIQTFFAEQQDAGRHQQEGDSH